MKASVVGSQRTCVSENDAVEKPSPYKQPRCKAAAVLDRVFGGHGGANAGFAAAIALLSQAGDKQMIEVLRGMMADANKLTDAAAIELCRAAAEMLRACE